MQALRWSDLALSCATLAFACVTPQALAAQTCIDPPYTDMSNSTVVSLMQRALPTISQFPSLQQALNETGPTICLSDAPSDAMGFYDPLINRVVIDAALPADLQLALLLHELRHVEQFQNGLCPDIDLSMPDYARARFALEADATAISLIVAHQMREHGDPGPWNAIAALPHYAETAAGFDASITESGDVAAASAAAFALWYQHEERRHAYYISSCSAYLDEQEARHAIPRYEALDTDFFARLCVLPDGMAFPCREPDVPLSQP